MPWPFSFVPNWRGLCVTKPFSGSRSQVSPTNSLNNIHLLYSSVTSWIWATTTFLRPTAPISSSCHLISGRQWNEEGVMVNLQPWSISARSSQPSTTPDQSNHWKLELVVHGLSRGFSLGGKLLFELAPSPWNTEQQWVHRCIVFGLGDFFFLYNCFSSESYLELDRGVFLLDFLLLTSVCLGCALAGPKRGSELMISFSGTDERWWCSGVVTVKVTGVSLVIFLSQVIVWAIKSKDLSW